MDRSVWWVVCALGATLALSPARAEAVVVPESAARGVAPGPFPQAPPSTPQAIPADILARRDHLTIFDVLEVALANDPRTQVAWRDARARAADRKIAQADWWPELDVAITGTRAKSVIQGGQFNVILDTYGPSAALTYVLADFGERAGNVAGAKADLMASVWAHGAAVQLTVLDTVQAYVAYVDAKAQLRAAQETEAEAKTSLDAASQRRDAGLATIADVLQAKTALSQATLNAQTIAGSIGSLRGALATSMGLPANVEFEVGELPAELPATEFGTAADAMIATALGHRPELAAAREQWLSARANVREVRGSWLPKLNFTGGYNVNYYDPARYADHSSTWSVGLALRVPVFNGLRNRFEIVKAKEQEARAAAQARTVEQTVINDVWSSWFDVKTAAQRIATTKDLLASATESEQVALGRYKEGVGTLLDVLNAQTALAAARAQEIGARADWLVSTARLLYSTGGLTGPDAVPGAEAQGETR
jgi:outer membrane protein